MATEFRDYSEYSTGDMATVGTADWTEQNISGNWTYTIATDVGETGDQICTVANNGSGDGFNLVVYDSFSTSSDIEVVAKVRFAGTGGPGFQLGPCLAQSDSAHYALEYKSGGTAVGIVRFSTGGSGAEAIGSNQTYTIPTDGSWFWIRLGRSSGTLQASAWDDGSSEPSFPQMSGTPSTALTTVKAGMVNKDASENPFDWDVFGTSTDGSGTAPTSEGGGGGVLGAISGEGGIAGHGGIAGPHGGIAG